jgi:hypothetical protein
MTPAATALTVRLRKIYGCPRAMQRQFVQRIGGVDAT